MAKRKSAAGCVEQRQRKVDFGKGQIADNALKAMVKSDLYLCKVERPMKGKGSFQRKGRHAWKRSDGDFCASDRLFLGCGTMVRRFLF